MEKKVEKPWGYYENLASGAGWHLKKIVIMPGQRTSLQSHKNRDEDWTVVEGQLIIEKQIPHSGRFKDILFKSRGEGEYIQRKTPHRMACYGTEPVVVIELITGVYDEDDIERYEDDYNRV